MRRILFSVVLVGFCSPNTFAAGPVDFPKLKLGIFDRKKKEDPAVKVKSLLETLKNDTDEKKRLAAAKELKDFDTKTNTEILPALINSLRQDPSTTVRSEAAESLGKAKPISTQAGVALELTVQADPSETVRKAAQGSLWQYHLAGYKGTGNAMASQTAEPPFATAKVKPTPPTVATALTQALPVQISVGRGAGFAQTVEPPLAKPKALTTPAPVNATTPPASIPNVPTEPAPVNTTTQPPSVPTVPGVPTIVPPSGPIGIPGVPTIPSPGGN